MTRQLDLLLQANTIYLKAHTLLLIDVPLSMILQLHSLVDQIVGRLATDSPQEEDFRTAGIVIGSANSILASIDGLDVGFITPLVTQAASIAPTFAVGAQPWTAVQPNCVCIAPALAILASPFTSATTVDKGDIAFLDLSLTTLQLMREFLVLFARNPHRQNEFKQRLPNFLTWLSGQQIESIRKARIAIAEMRQGIYVEQLIEVLRQPGTMTITVDPAYIIVGRPSVFRVDFASPILRDCMAKAEIVPRWNFGDQYDNELGNSGWSVMHYYHPSLLNTLHEVKLSVTFEICDRNSTRKVLQGNGQTVTLERRLTIHSDPDAKFWGQRSRAELLRLSVALVPAIATYVIAARDKFASLDLVTAIVVTFLAGAAINNLKDVIGPRPS